MHNAHRIINSSILLYTHINVLTVMSFFWQKTNVTNIHRRLTNIFGDMAVDKSTVSHWTKRLASSEQGKGNVSDLLCSGCPSTAVTPAAMQRADSHIRNDRRITTREFAAVLGIGKGSVTKSFTS
jgi:hypothetical protein